MNKENKASILSNATTHFRSAMTQELNEIEVPEWDCTIYFKTATTFATEKHY